MCIVLGVSLISMYAHILKLLTRFNISLNFLTLEPVSLNIDVECIAINSRAQINALES